MRIKKLNKKKLKNINSISFFELNLIKYDFRYIEKNLISYENSFLNNFHGDSFLYKSDLSSFELGSLEDVELNSKLNFYKYTQLIRNDSLAHSLSKQSSVCEPEEPKIKPILKH